MQILTHKCRDPQTDAEPDEQSIIHAVKDNAENMGRINRLTGIQVAQLCVTQSHLVAAILHCVRACMCVWLMANWKSSRVDRKSHFVVHAAGGAKCNQDAIFLTIYGYDLL